MLCSCFSKENQYYEIIINRFEEYDENNEISEERNYQWQEKTIINLMKDLHSKKILIDADINLVVRNSLLLVINLFAHFESRGSDLMELNISERSLYLEKLKILEFQN